MFWKDEIRKKESEMERKFTSVYRKAVRECHQELPPKDYPDLKVFIKKFEECVKTKFEIIRKRELEKAME